jgi:hypothetical protein
MNRNQVFAALRNFERANKEVTRLNRQFENRSQNYQRTWNTFNRLLSARKHPMSRQNAGTYELALNKWGVKLDEMGRLNEAQTRARAQLINAYQRVARAVHGIHPLIPGSPQHLSNDRRRNVRRVLRTIGSLENARRLRTAARVGAAWRNKARQRQVRSAHISLTRSGLPKNIVRKITSRAFRN